MDLKFVGKTNVDKLKHGINFVNLFDDNNVENKLIIYKDNNGYKCYRNICRHQGGTFMKQTNVGDIGDIEDINTVVKCCRHGWKLNCSDSTYCHNKNVKQELLTYFIYDNFMTVYEEKCENPWNGSEVVLKKKPINENEFYIKFITHASIEITCGDDVIFTDPWFEGPAFGRGWWPLFKNLDDAYSRLSKASIIYISHFHSDHLSYCTLKKLYDINPDVHIIVGDLKHPVWRGGICGDVKNLKFKNIHVVKLSTWFNVSNDTRIMILPDGIYDDVDTCLLVEYKGHKIMNLVDCCSPNNNVLPDDLDIIFGDFAGGAGGYPSIYYEMYGMDKTYEIAKKNAKLFLNKVVGTLKKTNCKLWVPFAGYFIESHPSDTIIKNLNYHNDPFNSAKFVENSIPGIKTWIPFPDGKIDVKTLVGDNLLCNIENYYVDYSNFDFNKYTDYYKYYNYDKDLDKFNNEIGTFEGIKKYFEWANFKNYDLILHVIETDDNFETSLKEYFVDFFNLTFPKTRPKDRNYFRIKVRQDMMRYIMTSGNSWELLYIGFSGRYYHEPIELYPAEFKLHFEQKLPEMSII